MQEIQKSFIQQLNQKLKPGTLLVRELMELLKISKSEAYNKIRGASFLTLQQIDLLCKKFEIDFTVSGAKDQQSSQVTFLSFQETGHTVADYILVLERMLQDIKKAKNQKISCATDDIPIFHLFRYPELTAFKLHFWQMRSVPGAAFVFNYEDWDQQLLHKAYNMYEVYRTIPSVEIWTKSSLLNSLEQIKYAGDVGIIRDKKTGELICNQLRSAIADIEKYAINHSKSKEQPVSFDWYFYDIIGSITYLAEMDEKMVSFIRFNTFNTLQARDQPLCKEIRHWMHNLVADSIGFSGQGSVQRNKYLATAYDSCDEIAKNFGA